MFYTFSQPHNPALKPMVRTEAEIQETLRNLLRDDNSADIAYLNLDIQQQILLKVRGGIIIKIVKHNTLSGRN